MHKSRFIKAGHFSNIELFKCLHKSQALLSVCQPAPNGLRVMADASRVKVILCTTCIAPQILTIMTRCWFIDRSCNNLYCASFYTHEQCQTRFSNSSFKIQNVVTQLHKITSSTLFTFNFIHKSCIFHQYRYLSKLFPYTIDFYVKIGYKYLTCNNSNK